MTVFTPMITVATVALAFGASPVAARTYPTRPVRIIVPAAVGGGLDLTTRLVAQKMSEKLGQPVIVENRPGADTLLGTRIVKSLPADGYTILAQANGFSVLPAMKLDPGYDPLKDFTGIGPMLRAPQIMVVGASQPDRTLQDFVARAKSGKLLYASAGVGGPPHIGAALFLQQTHLDVEHVPYKGNGAALPDVAGGRVPMIFGAYVAMAPYIQGGQLRPLGVTGNARIAALPSVPTFKEQGVDYTYYFWLGLLARAGTPHEVVEVLSEALRYATTSKDLAERFRAEGSEPMSISPREFDDYLTKEVAQMARLMADLKVVKQ